MTPRVRDALAHAGPVIESDTSLTAASRAMTVAGVGAVVVSKKGELVGMLYAVDLDAARPSAATTLSVREVGAALDQVRVAALARPVPPVTPRTPLAEAARLLRDCDVQALPVVQADAIIGVLSALDVVEWTFNRRGDGDVDA